MPARLECTIGGIVGSARVDVPVIASPGKGIDLPAKQIAIKRLRTVGVVCRDFKPNDARRLFLLLLVHVFFLSVDVTLEIRRTNKPTWDKIFWLSHLAVNAALQPFQKKRALRFGIRQFK